MKYEPIVMTTENKTTLNVSVEGGKYTVLAGTDANGHYFKATRYDEPWQDLTGNKFVYCLASELQETRDALDALLQLEELNLGDPDSKSEELVTAVGKATRLIRNIHKCKIPDFAVSGVSVDTHEDGVEVSEELAKMLKRVQNHTCKELRYLQGSLADTDTDEVCYWLMNAIIAHLHKGTPLSSIEAAIGAIDRRNAADAARQKELFVTRT